MSVVLPAPFGPSKPNNSPYFTPKFIYLNANFALTCLSPAYIFLRSLITRRYDGSFGSI